MRLLPLLSTLAILIAATSAAHAGLKVTQKTLTAKSATYDISIAYPQTGVKAIDDDMAAWAKTTADQFRADAGGDHQADERPYDLEVTYSVARNDAQVFAVLFEEYTDTGGAHPNHDYYTADYLMPDGWRVYLPELVEGARGLARLSDTTSKDLDARIGTGADAISDPDSIKMGTSLYWDNYRSFVLLPNAIDFYFPPYQVASYAAGPQESRVPLTALRGVMRPDPRKPAASFDCAAARSVGERLICSDVGLARLDRAVSDAYAVHFRYPADTPANIKLATALRADQRAWLARRDAACGPAGPSLPCLSKLYKDRAAWLAKQP